MWVIHSSLLKAIQSTYSNIVSWHWVKSFLSACKILIWTLKKIDTGRAQVRESSWNQKISVPCVPLPSLPAGQPLAFVATAGMVKGRRKRPGIPFWVQGEYPLLQARSHCHLGCTEGIHRGNNKSHLAAQPVGSCWWGGVLPSWIQIYEIVSLSIQSDT